LAFACAPEPFVLSTERTDRHPTDPLELLLQISNDGICLLDEQGRCVGISTAGAALLGYHSADLEGAGFHELVHADPGEREWECALCGTDSGETEGEASLRHRDRGVVEVRFRARPVPIEDGGGRLIVFSTLPDAEAHNGAAAASHEGLQRAMAEFAAEKQRSEAMQGVARQLLTTPLGDLETELVEQVRAFTSSKLALLYKHDEATGEFVLAASRGVFRTGVAERTAGSQKLDGVMADRRPLVEDHADAPIELAGRSIYQLMYVPLSNDEEDLGLLVLGRTTTRPFSTREREAAAQLGGLATAALSNSRLVSRLEHFAQLARGALDGIAEAIRLVDSEGRELLVNARMRELNDELGLGIGSSVYGVEASEFAERTTDPEGYMAELRALQLNPERRSRTDWELVESGRAFERYSAPLRDSLGTLTGRVIVLREITAERAADRMQDELISLISHEVRTPLTSILAFVNLLLEEDVQTEDSRTYAETVRNEINRLLTIVDDLLRFRRIGEGTFAPELRKIDLRKLIQEQVKAFAPSSRLHKIVSRLPSEPLYVEADAAWITQVLSNIISNAVKYSPSGGVIEIAAEGDQNVVHVVVSDPGIGIPESERDKVFAKFGRVRSDQTANVRGLGIGLALSREIVLAHRGRIGFESTPGVGSEFWFELPAP
jgi:PAS domain S-box-containing protein